FEEAHYGVLLIQSRGGRFPRVGPAFSGHARFLFLPSSSSFFLCTSYFVSFSLPPPSLPTFPSKSLIRTHLPPFGFFLTSRSLLLVPVSLFVSALRLLSLLVLLALCIFPFWLSFLSCSCLR
ncbi:hypothetical protein BDQ17DRAFT_1546830, partial [Cyathus striatus]